MEKTKQLKCPWCGRKINHYKCNNGEFYGCSGYPKCNYKRNIKYTQQMPKIEDKEKASE